jgi:DNA-binding GntR family transcriptional regulator
MEKREPRSRLIARQLREAILSGHLHPGARVRQEAVGERYGASRVPVQQALRELAEEGLVTLEPNVGARVARFDLSELIEIYRAREAVEPMVLAESIPHLTEVDLAEIERLVEVTEGCARRGDRLAYVEADRPMHMATFRGAGFARLAQMITGLWDTTQQYRRIYGLLPASVETSVVEHRLLLELMRNRNADDAARLLTVHIRRTWLGMAKYVEQLEAGSVASNGSWNGEAGMGAVRT